VINSCVSNSVGFQFLDVGTNTFQPPFLSQAGAGSCPTIPEDLRLDPLRNLLLDE
jgi:hypothetical protein